VPLIKHSTDTGPNCGQMEDPIGLTDAARYARVAYSTMAQAVREGRVKARRIGEKTWMTSKQDVQDAIDAGRLRPSA
jgi:hypothetical protein